jgi:hypothetical protein
MLTRVPTFDGTTAKLTGRLSAPALNVMPAANTSAVLGALLRSQADNPAEAWEHDVLFEATHQEYPLVQRSEAAAFRVEPFLELPAELRDERLHFELAFGKLVDDALAERRHAEPRTRQAHRLCWRRLGEGRR